jgi:hypothetical protein
MHDFWPRLKETVPRLARGLRPEDEVKLVAFSGPAYLVQDYTRDPARVRRSMERFSEWGGGTSLYDTLAAVGTEMAWVRAGRQVVLLITDGVDTLSRIDAPRLRGYLRRTVVTVESLALPGRAVDRARLPKSLNVLKQLARETGGDVRLVPDPDGIGAAFADLARNLENRYCVSWTSDLASREGWRSLEVLVRRPGATVRTRSGRVGRVRSAPSDRRPARARGADAQRRRVARVAPGRRRRRAAGALGDHAPEVRAAAAYPSAGCGSRAPSIPGSPCSRRATSGALVGGRGLRTIGRRRCRPCSTRSSAPLRRAAGDAAAARRHRRRARLEQSIACPSRPRARLDAGRGPVVPTPQERASAPRSASPPRRSGPGVARCPPDARERGARSRTGRARAARGRCRTSALWRRSGRSRISAGARLFSAGSPP